jgi:hypothetical protein
MASKKKTPVKPNSSAGAFRLADEKANAKAGKNQVVITKAPAAPSTTGNFSTPSSSDIMAYFKELAAQNASSAGGGGGNSSMVNAANQLAWDRKKFRMEQNAKREQELYDRQVAANQNTRDATALQNQRSGLDEYLAALQGQIDAGPSGYGQKQEALKTQLGGIYDTAKSTIGSSQAGLEKSLAAMVNPFAGYQAQAAPTFNTSNLEQLLRDSQVGTDPLQRMAALQQNENAGQTNAFQNLMNNLGNVYQGSMDDRLANARQSSTYASNQADMNKAALMSQLSGEQSDILEKLKQALLAGRLQRSQLGN